LIAFFRFIVVYFSPDSLRKSNMPTSNQHDDVIARLISRPGVREEVERIEREGDELLDAALQTDALARIARGPREAITHSAESPPSKRAATDTLKDSDTLP
jgi:hypothetical protein